MAAPRSGHYQDRRPGGHQRHQRRGRPAVFPLALARGVGDVAEQQRGGYRSDPARHRAERARDVGDLGVDVGTNATPDGGLAGDVDPKVADVAGALSPVPGGVGPVTTALLLRHVTSAAGR